MKTSLLVLTTLLVTIFTVSFRSAKTQETTAAGASVANAQSTAFSFLRTHRQGKGITATWGVNSTEEVLDFIVQRTYDDPTDTYAYWENVATVAASSSRSFTYTDKEVFPGTIYYRVVALLTDGSTVESGISGVRIVSRH
jgi:hypothetical protein